MCWVSRGCIPGHVMAFALTFLNHHCSCSVCPNNCSGNGLCKHGACYCQSGWSGESCDMKVCPSQCSVSVNIIICAPTRPAAFVRLRWMPFDLTQMCVCSLQNHGRCDKKEKCHCLTNWTDIDYRFVVRAVTSLPLVLPVTQMLQF